MSERDHSLIAEFNARRCEDAFAALVRQHVNLVFATALRQVGDHGTAEEITQNVFVALAESAGKLGSHPTIAGWLYQTTLNKSRERLRADLRRRRREQVAVNLELAGAEGDSVWASLVPLLDEALLELREADRLAVMLHFMEGRTFCEVGSALGIGEDAARKRANRCLDQLTNFFRRHGFNVPALTAGTPLFALSSPAAPAGLAASATTAGLAASHSAASTLTFIKGTLKIMAWTKTKTAVVASVVVLLAAGSAMVVIHNWENDLHHREQPSDAIVRQELPGTWTETGADGVIKTITIDPDGHTTMKLSGRSSGGSEGTTQVRNGFLIATITKSSQPMTLPFTNSVRIIWMDDRELVVQGDRSSQVVYKKVKP